MWLDVFTEMRKKSGMSIDEISAKSGVPKGTLSKISAGITKAPPLETMRKLVHSMGYTLDDLDKGLEVSNNFSEEEKSHIKKYRALDPYGKEAVDSILEIEHRRCAELAQATQTEPDMVYFVVPGFGSAMSAGTGQPAGDEYPENYKLTKEPPRGTSYIAPVGGHSMEPSYFDGQLVFVHATEEIPVGKIGVFIMDGQQWVKELGEGELISHNPDPQYIPRPFTEDVRCQGLVLGVCDESYFE